MDKLRLKRMFPLIAFILFLTVAPSAMAWDGNAGSSLFGGMFFLFLIGLCIAVYVYMAMALMIIATKTNTENGWLAWIPIANFFLLLSIAKKPAWWFLLLFIPFINLIILIVVWMEVCEACGKEKWLGLLMLIPLANLILPGYLAWSD